MKRLAGRPAGRLAADARAGGQRRPRRRGGRCDARRSCAASAIDVDLAPVLDTPSSPSSWLGSRAFSRNRFVNATLGTAFVDGLQQGGVAATAKHFPGLGTARTDDRHVRVVVDDSRARLSTAVCARSAGRSPPVSTW